ncbi:hypothetical protein OCU04_003895 [Sclerotinia nivalis]|uniref:Uncharacterized protein n=1 Tax=Sclerotinia nivalis TaxID=352851 RepID=A0A9X0ATS5_9HELO|nr:hypothetical protein OCU04_003895 [Sclerotinia nivalis]
MGPPFFWKVKSQYIFRSVCTRLNGPRASIDLECSKALDDLQRGNLPYLVSSAHIFCQKHLEEESFAPFAFSSHQPSNSLMINCLPLSRCMRRKRRTTKQASKQSKEVKQGSRIRIKALLPSNWPKQQ